jgi:VCBS repeat-containing protein
LAVPTAFPYGRAAAIALPEIGPSPQHLVVVDRTVAEADCLVANLAPGTQVLWLDPLHDAIGQITQTLLQTQGIDSIHILSHGSAGRVQLGSTLLEAGSLARYQADLQQWAAALSPEADILLYGCQVGAGDLGQSLMQQLADFTGADVAASTNDTGDAAQGGDWVLEVNTGEITAQQVLDATALSSYRYLLPVAPVSIQGSTLGNQIHGGAFGSFTGNSSNGSTWAADSVSTSLQSVSEDGRYSVFVSDASNLGGSGVSDNNFVRDVFLRDRLSGTTTLISRNSSGTGSGNSESYHPVISSDGGYVAFVSRASNLVSGGTTAGRQQVYLWERSTGTLTLLSRNSSGSGEGDSDSFYASISNDGSRVAFTSRATNLSPNTATNTSQVYVWDRGQASANQLLKASLNANGQEANDARTAADYPALISGNGRYVVFYSHASNLISGNDGNGSNGRDLFVRDLQTNTTLLVNAKAGDANSSSNDSASRPTISDDGRYVAFLSFSSDLVAGQTPLGRHAYVRDLQTDTTQWVSFDQNNNPIGPWIDMAVISRGGQHVVFGEGAGGQSYVRYLPVGATPARSERVNLNSSGGVSNAGVTQGDTPFSISRDGRYVVFATTASNLDASDTNGLLDVYLRDLVLDTTQLVSSGANGVGNGNSYTPVISGNGSVVVFTSAASNLASGDSNAVPDVFVYTPDPVPNRPPMANNGSLSGDEDTSLTGTVSVTDPDNDPWSVSVVGQPSRGSLSLNPNGSFRYTPEGDRTSTERFTYVAVDSQGLSSSVATVWLTVNPVNDAPVAQGETYTVNSTATLNINPAGVLANDSDIDSPNLSAAVVTSVAHGTLSLNADGSFSYRPDAGFSGTDQFTYRASDGSLNATATVSLVVTPALPPANQLPTANNGDFSGLEDQPISGSLSATDPDNNTPLTYTLVSQAQAGSVSLNADGSFNYTPSPNSHGSDRFTYLAIDQLGGRSNTATVSLGITPVNDAPSFTPGANQQVQAGAGSQTVNLWASGFNPGPNETGQTLSGYVVSVNDPSGVLVDAPTLSPQGRLVYTPVANLATAATATVSVQAQDNGGTANGGVDLSPVQTFLIAVTPTAPQPSLAVADVSRAEGNSGNTPYDFTVRLSAANTRTVTVHYATADESAIAGSDYVAASGTLTFAPGQTQTVVRVTGLGDRTLEADETFRFELSAPSNAQLATRSAQGTLVNDDLLPSLSLSPVSRREGNSGMSPIQLTLSLSAPSAETVRVSYRTSDGTAIANQDYAFASGTVVFDPGQTSQIITLEGLGDSQIEPTETFIVQLSSPNNATLATDQAIVTLVNDDGVRASDFDGDGYEDLVWSNPTTGENRLWLMTETLRRSEIVLPRVSLGWRMEGVGDLNRDGNPDIIWRNSSNGRTSAWLMQGTRVAQTVELMSAGADWNIRGVADFNSDGSVDLLWRNARDGRTSIAFLNGTTRLSTLELGTIATHWSIEAVGDSNQDGQPDIFWRDTRSGRVTVWQTFGSGSSLFYRSAEVTQMGNLNMGIAKVADFNQNGTLDFAWRNLSSGSNSIWLWENGSVIADVPLPSMANAWRLL